MSHIFEEFVGRSGSYFLHCYAGELTSIAATIVNGPEQGWPSQYKQEANIQWQQGGPVPSVSAEPPPNMSPLLPFLCLSESVRLGPFVPVSSCRSVRPFSSLVLQMHLLSLTRNDFQTSCFCGAHGLNSLP